MSDKRFKASARSTPTDSGNHRTALAEITGLVSPHTRKDRPKAIRIAIRGIVDRRVRDFPSTACLLTSGGDSRIVCGPLDRNRYGCSPLPDPEMLAYGSSTASTISAAGFMAADALRARLKQGALIEVPAVTYERELDRVRRELAVLCGLDDIRGLEIIFGASGTDLHLLAGQLVADASEIPPLIVRVEASETGTGVPEALEGRHFNDCTALGDTVRPNVTLDCGRPVQILEIRCRTAQGNCRSAAEIDAEVEAAVTAAAETGRRVLLTLVDVSKTGLIAPSPACVHSLRCRFPKLIEVLVDACQFRLAPSTLRAYLEHHFLVAVTGSKFLPGPTFCGALFVPPGPANRLARRALPRALKSYSTRADWPQHWLARATLDPVANFGLLLRWEAALTELRAFRELPDDKIAAFVKDFSRAVTERLHRSPAFEPLPAPALDRAPIAPGDRWDRVATIFPFLLLRSSACGRRTWLNPSETKAVQELLRSDLCPTASLVSSLRCQLGRR